MIKKSSKRIEGKKQQVTKVLNKITVSLKHDIKVNKNLITPEDTDELYEELYNVTAFIDFLAMDDEPQKRITVKEYKELFVREKELQKILKAIENDKESLGSLNRTFSYIDEWL